MFVCIPTDPSLTCSSLLAAVETMTLAYDVLGVPYATRKELHQCYPEKSDYKEACVSWYLKISPYASWEHVGGRLLLLEEDK